MEPLTLPSTLDSLKPIREYVRSAATAASLDKRSANRLELAVDEIATNIIMHGYRSTDREEMLHLSTHLSDETLTVMLEDTAPPFDPLTHEPPDDLDAPLEDREIGGLGIYLAIRSVDEFRYERKDGCNRNIFIVRRSSAPVVQ